MGRKLRATPLLTIPVSALAGPLLLRKQGPDGCSVEFDANGQRLVVGRIMAVSRGSMRQAWFWTITGSAAPGALVALSGDAESREEARAGFRAMGWHAWLGGCRARQAAGLACRGEAGGPVTA
jgi:hypothetical protein